jgi:hypothetical protein
MSEANGQFWSEDFDTDLFKVLPKVRPILEAFDDRPIYTVGHTTNGRLNHPACWNSDGGFVSYFGFTNSAEGFVPSGYYFGNSQVIQCTFAEVIRDAWVHPIRGVVKVGDEYRSLFDSQRISWAFSELMYDMRGWNQPKRDPQAIWKARHASTRWVLNSAKRFKIATRRMHWIKEGV